MMLSTSAGHLMPISIYICQRVAQPRKHPFLINRQSTIETQLQI